MRNKNEDIHLFIMEEDREENRERALREKALREKLQEPSEQLVKALQDPLNISEEPAEKETTSSNEGNKSTSVKPESDLRVHTQVEMEACWMKPAEVGSLGFVARALVISTLVYALSLISAIALLQLNAVVTQNLYSYGLQSGLEWATPYWTAMRAALGMLGLTAIAELFQIIILMHRSREIASDGLWKKYALPDGSTIRVKTVVKEVKRLNEYGHDGKPIYTVKADNVVEVLEVPETL